MDATTILKQELVPLARKRILDIGCGTGTLVRSLREAGAIALGIDPAAPTSSAAQSYSALYLHQGSGEDLPFPDQSFDAAIFVNSLHHVPVELMDRALAEAGRVVVLGGKIIIAEPLAQGPFFDPLKPVEDETKVRETAQEAIRCALIAGRFTERKRFDLVRRDTFPSIVAFLERIIAADNTRYSATRQSQKEVESAFLAASRRNAGGDYMLEQPIRAYVLANP